MLKGIYAPIPTPFGADGEIDWNSFNKNLQWWGKSSLQGLAVAGTNGEAVLLDTAEKAKAFAFVRENLPAKMKVIAGTGCESARATIRLSRSAAESGCDAVLVINPSFFKGSLDEETLYNYFTHVAENSPLPVILYNMPRNTALNMSSSLVTRLSVHPNIVGIKDSSGNIVQIGDIINKSAEGFAVFAGSANFLLPSLVLGATGGTLALANIMPEECVQIQELYETGSLDDSKKLQMKLMEINRAVTALWGVSGLKAAMDLLGLYGGPPRLPLLPLDDKKRESLQKIMQGLQLI